MIGHTEKVLRDFAELFRDWDKKIDYADFTRYTCKKCGKLVRFRKDWVRGKTLCRSCFDD